MSPELPFQAEGSICSPLGHSFVKESPRLSYCLRHLNGNGQVTELVRVAQPVARDNPTDSKHGHRDFDAHRCTSVPGQCSSSWPLRQARYRTHHRREGAVHPIRSSKPSRQATIVVFRISHRQRIISHIVACASGTNGLPAENQFA